MSESWSIWEGEVVNGTYALRHLLGKSDHSAVFLTDMKAQGVTNAALKILPANSETADTQLAIWRTTMALSHPHVTRILDAGRCARDDQDYLFVVMEHAEESLGEILPHRALTSNEVRGLLPPMLDALAFLHRNNLVYCQLKPSNVLVINDEVKLASDPIGPAGVAPTGMVGTTVYDPPESRSGRRSAAGDMWALGVTVVEALTQRLPAWTDQRAQSATLPANLPRAFIDVALRCLNPTPVARPTPEELQAEISGEATAPMAAMPEPVAAAYESPTPQELDHAATAPRVPSRRRRSIITFIVTLILVVLVIGAGAALLQSRRSAPAIVNATSATERVPAPVPAPALQSPVDSAAAQVASASPEVLHEALPLVPPSANETIHGHLRVVVRVIVDRSGKVVDETLEDSGPSPYFARLASDAARKWRFAAADRLSTRAWLVRFEFSRDQTTARADAAVAP